MSEENLQEIQTALGHQFSRLDFLREALTHPSCKVNAAAARDYQRLEFLGDAVLGLVLAEALFQNPDAAEGELTAARARLVRGSKLAEKGRQLELGRWLRVPDQPGAEKIRKLDKAHEDALEAVVGAVFLDGGWLAARTVVLRLFAEELANGWREEAKEGSVKIRLQEKVQSAGTGAIGERMEYRTVAEEGLPHARRFTVEVWIDGECRGRGAGVSKRTAGEAAAVVALRLWPEA